MNFLDRRRVVLHEEDQVVLVTEWESLEEYYCFQLSGFALLLRRVVPDQHVYMRVGRAKPSFQKAPSFHEASNETTTITII
jgi:hypothetical protein